MHEVFPDAKLMMLVYKPTTTIYQAYRRCYSENASLFDELPNLSEQEAFIRKMLKAEHPHESPLEHVSYSFHITCSRACSHQLVRHRLASYSQQSQRYVPMNDIPFIMPPDIDASEEAYKTFTDYVWQMEIEYKSLIEAGIEREDARYILGNCVATMLIVTMNCRELLHFFAERCCHRAQWEIRTIANKMLKIMQKELPCVFENAGPKCFKTGHCPELKPCGKKPYTLANA